MYEKTINWRTAHSIWEPFPTEPDNIVEEEDEAGLFLDDPKMTLDDPNDTDYDAANVAGPAEPAAKGVSTNKVCAGHARLGCSCIVRASLFIF